MLLALATLARGSAATECALHCDLRCPVSTVSRGSGPPSRLRPAAVATREGGLARLLPQDARRLSLHQLNEEQRENINEKQGQMVSKAGTVLRRWLDMRKGQRARAAPYSTVRYSVTAVTLGAS